MLEEVKFRAGVIRRAAEQQAAALRADDRGILGEVRMIGGGLVMMLVMVLVLTEVWNAISPSTDAEGNYDGVFGSVFGAVESTGTAGLTLLVVGFLVVAATAIMRFFGGGFGMGGR